MPDGAGLKTPAFVTRHAASRSNSQLIVTHDGCTQDFTMLRHQRTAAEAYHFPWHRLPGPCQVWRCTNTPAP